VTRRDRAAMALALELVREMGGRRAAPESWTALHRASEALFMGSLAATRLAHAVHGEIRRLAFTVPFPRREIAKFRARLALYLRAALRADAGDFGIPACSCGEPWTAGHVPGGVGRWYAPAEGCEQRFGRKGHDWLPRSLAPVRPLWELATRSKP
jgi:hypothetical protein